jgi:hypothetical protein
VQTATGTASASFFGNKVQLRGLRAKMSIGALTWFDPTWQGQGLVLQIVRVKSYRRLPGSTTRELVGLASANGKGKHRFVLQVVDSGTPGSGSDSVSLQVKGVAGSGAGGTGAGYSAVGHLAQGDVTTNLHAVSSR